MCAYVCLCCRLATHCNIWRHKRHKKCKASLEDISVFVINRHWTVLIMFRIVFFNQILSCFSFPQSTLTTASTHIVIQQLPLQIWRAVDWQEKGSQRRHRSRSLGSSGKRSNCQKYNHKDQSPVETLKTTTSCQSSWKVFFLNICTISLASSCSPGALCDDDGRRVDAGARFARGFDLIGQSVTADGQTGQLKKIGFCNK
jgi:hypothetical protein